MTIRTKLFAAFVGIAVGPFMIVSSITLWRNGVEAEADFADTADRTARQAALSLDGLIEPANRALAVMAASRTVAELSRKPSGKYVDNLGEWYTDALQIRNVVRTVGSTTPMISDFAVVMDDGLAGFSESSEFHHLSEDRSESWRKAMDSGPRELLWFAPEDFDESKRRDAFSGIARIRDPEDLLQTVAFARADIPRATFRTIMENAELSEDSFALIVDGASRIAISSFRGRVPREETLGGLAAYGMPAAAEQKSADLTFGVERMLVSARPLAAPGWRFLLAIPYRDVVSQAERSRARSILIFSLIVPLLFPAAWLLARSSTCRIRSLRDRLALVGSGHPQVRADDGGSDEISELSRRFNEMTLRIDSLLKEEYELGRRVNELELGVLQAQINPHFLYNTLDMVNCMALARGETEISGAVAALARFYRASLAGGAKNVPLSAELDHVRSYVAVENLRFDDRIGLEIDVPEKLAAFMMPKLTLQPLVENAVHHGILEKPEERGTVRIAAHEEGRFIVIRVSDDGAGLKEPDSLPGAPLEEKSAGYGLRNIRDRLTLTFGEDAVLILEQRTEGGCAATVRVPAGSDMRVG